MRLELESEPKQAQRELLALLAEVWGPHIQLGWEYSFQCSEPKLQQIELVGWVLASQQALEEQLV